jgi:hypothetical protein
MRLNCDLTAGSGRRPECNKSSARSRSAGDEAVKVEESAICYSLLKFCSILAQLM